MAKAVPARKGKSGCLKANGKLKAGFKFAKGGKCKRVAKKKKK